MTAWPVSVWRSPWLSGFDGGARATLEAAGMVCALEKDEPLFAPGELADRFFVIDEGVLEVLAVKRGEAQVSRVRRALAGDAVGEEAVVRGGFARLTGARSVTRARVVGVPISVYLRLRERAGGAPTSRSWERDLRQAAARDVLLASSLARVLDARRVGMVARAAVHRQLARGETLFVQGDPCRDAMIVADGMVSLEIEAQGCVRIEAYLGRGDLVTDGAVASRTHAMTARASGPAWILVLPADTLSTAGRSAPDAFASVRRVALPVASPEATRHVGVDLWRYAVAGSMLVIDGEACVRCGHCAWSCADVHADGASRLLRRGEKVAVRDATDGTPRALIVPRSCQHCKQPACMIGCPTGAIGRGARGEVTIREDLCVGCGQCERACPWGSVHMAPRSSTGAGVAGGLTPSEQVAVKCDLCAGRETGPACVRACPVEAIARVEPLAVFADVREAIAARVPRAPLPRARRGWPWILGGMLVASASARAAAPFGPGLGSGCVAGALVALLVAYSGCKRLGLGRVGWLPGARVQAIAHLVLGLITAGVVAAHAHWRAPPGAAGGALLAFLLASLTGGLAVVCYTVLPARLARVERRARLPEDLPPRAIELAEQTFAALTGRSAASKALFARFLSPYAASPLGGVALVASGRSLREEEARVRAKLEQLAPGRAVDGLPELVRLVVERRAVKAQRLLQSALVGCVSVHIVSVAIALVLLAVHVASVAGHR